MLRLIRGCLAACGFIYWICNTWEIWEHMWHMWTLKWIIPWMVRQLTPILRKNWTDNRKKDWCEWLLPQFSSFSTFYQVFFSESIANIVSNKLSHEKFQSDKNYRLFIVGVYRQNLVVFEWYLSTNKNL